MLNDRFLRPPVAVFGDDEDEEREGGGSQSTSSGSERAELEEAGRRKEAGKYAPGPPPERGDSPRRLPRTYSGLGGVAV